MAFEYMKDPGWQYLRQTDEQRLKDQSRPYDSKKNVWIPDPEEGFIAGEIKSTKGDDVTVVTAKGQETTLNKDLVQEMNPPKFDKCEDMSNLSFLNDASVLGNLRGRYSEMLIYTYSGLFCVVINPYKRLPIYTESVAQMYMGKRKNEMPPHLFANSDEAYRNMLQDRECQSMLITGESGAGKTENTKKVISYFAAVGASQGPKKEVDPNVKKVTLEDQIVQTNPVLEAFGNAKTVRNNNSSRFGKFIRIHFSGSGKVASCDIEHYLLEKSRVVRQAPGERCYHIFYQMYTSSDLRDKLELDKDIADYSSCNQAELTIAGVDDSEEFAMMDEAFDILQFSATEKLDCYRLMSAIMHMYDMKFKQKPRDEQAEADGTDEAKKAANMMSVDYEKLINSLLKPKVKVGKEWVNKGQNLEQVRWAIGAMSRGVYDRVFNWLVSMCNKTLDQKELERKYFIGVLDIAGFEIFDFNSFEQLWINFVNEKLQQFFNHHMFVLEQEEYKKEGIDWVFIDFGLDLAACIELIEKPMGIIAMLDEECIVPKATDATLAQKLIDQHLGKHPNFVKPKPPKGKQAEAHFAMAHYAGLVRYNVTNWLEKNKDPLNDTCVSVMKQNNGNALLLEIWQNYTTQEEQAELEKAGGARKKGKSAAMSSVSAKYRESLQKLMDMLHQTHPHFVRCLIPNECKKSGMLEAGLVMNQLTCNGVLEGIRICRKGFPNRMLHSDFRQRYSILGADEAKSSDDLKVCAEAVLNKIVKEGKLQQDNFRVGLTKVFFKAGILAAMEDLRDETLSAIMVGLQSKARWYMGLITAKKRKDQAFGRSVIQNSIRSWIELRSWPWYALMGKSKGLAGTVREKEELERLQAEHASMDTKLKEEEAARKAIEEKMANLEASMSELEEELNKRRALEGDSEAKIVELSGKKSELEKSLADLQSRQSREEDRGGELRRQKARLEGDREDARKAIREMETTLKRTEADRNNKGVALQTLEADRALQEETLARLTKEHQHQSELNEKLRKDCLAAQENMNELAKEKSNSQRRVDDLESNLDRERRDRFDVERENQQLESKLRNAMNKIEQLTQSFLEMEHRTKMKEQELMSSYARVKDEALQAQRLEQQVMDVSNTLQSMGRRLAVAQRY